MDGNHHQALAVRSAKVVMASPDVGHFEAGSLQGPQQSLTADPRQPGQGVATSSSTISVSASADGMESPSFAAASK